MTMRLIYNFMFRLDFFFRFQGEESYFDEETAFQCLLCAAGCESCVDSSPCIVTLNWVLRTILLILQCVIIGCLPVVVLFTYKYKEIKVQCTVHLQCGQSSLIWPTVCSFNV